MGKRTCVVYCPRGRGWWLLDLRNTLFLFRHSFLTDYMHVNYLHGDVPYGYSVCMQIMSIILVTTIHHYSSQFKLITPISTNRGKLIRPTACKTNKYLGQITMQSEVKKCFNIVERPRGEKSLDNESFWAQKSNAFLESILSSSHWAIHRPVPLRAPSLSSQLP